jgi:lipoic acid synthetase
MTDRRTITITPTSSRTSTGTPAPDRRPHRRHPDWLRVRLPHGPTYERLKGTMRGLRLHTVCEEALCPNVGECWGRGTATFMILGDVCTRGCRYCAVSKGHPGPLDVDEPARVGEAAERMGLRHVVLTSVDRDDLEDGGAGIFAATIAAIRDRLPACRVEVLIPDFQGRRASLEAVLAARPDVMNHNIETVPRLFPTHRLGGDYALSLELLERSREIAPSIPTKSGMMLGMGETDDEVRVVLGDLRRVGVEILTLGQYLQPGRKQAPVDRYVTPSAFADWRLWGESMGFRHVESGPLVRSSYHAESQLPADAPPRPTGACGDDRTL